MFYMNRCYSRVIALPIIAPIHIKHVHSSVSYQQATYQKYEWCGHESPNGYGPLESAHVHNEIWHTYHYTTHPNVRVDMILEIRLGMR